MGVPQVGVDLNRLGKQPRPPELRLDPSVRGGWAGRGRRRRPSVPGPVVVSGRLLLTDRQYLAIQRQVLGVPAGYAAIVGHRHDGVPGPLLSTWGA